MNDAILRSLGPDFVGGAPPPRTKSKAPSRRRPRRLDLGPFLPDAEHDRRRPRRRSCVRSLSRVAAHHAKRYRADQPARPGFLPAFGRHALRSRYPSVCDALSLGTRRLWRNTTIPTFRAIFPPPANDVARGYFLGDAIAQQVAPVQTDDAVEMHLQPVDQCDRCRIVEVDERVNSGARHMLARPG